MTQNAEGRAFLRRLGELPDNPGVDLGPAIAPSLKDEADLRRLFATDRDNTRLKDPYVGLVDVFGQNTDRIKKIHARAVKDDDDLVKYHIMPLDNYTRKKDGELSMAPSLEDFKLRWSVFSEGALSQLTNWDNIVAAGGSVLACLAPLPGHVFNQRSRREVRKYYHSEGYPASDVDLFLYGLTPEQAEEKCNEIYNAVRESVPWDVCVVRTKNALSIHCQYPYRPVQIVLRIYQSPAEILAGFDIDSACVAFDGTRVLAAPRAIVAMMTQCNRVAMDRRSPSYEVRLAKYAARGFEIHVPDLRREDFDPTIFERSFTRLAGLARLLVLEKLSTQEARDRYASQRRQIRARPNPAVGRLFGRTRVSRRRGKRRNRNLEADLKTADEFYGLQMSEYDAMFHIPYGPGITAKMISDIVYSMDFNMNSTSNPYNKNRRLHRHPAFFGNMEEALGDCCKIRDSSEDDWSSQDDEDKDYEEAKKKVDPKGDPISTEEDLLEDSADRPDILNIDVPDWDQGLTPLGYAIFSGSLKSVQILVAAGADCKTPRALGEGHQSTSTFLPSYIHPSSQTTSTFYPLTLTALTPDESVGAQIAEHLITSGGASCAAADSDTVTVLHRLVALNKVQIVEAILKVDPTAKVASRFLYSKNRQAAIHPIVTAFAGGQRAMVAVLLAYGGMRPFVDLETYDRSVAANPDQSGRTTIVAGEASWKFNTLQPLEASLADYNDLYRLVLALEPEVVKDLVPRGVHQYQAQMPGYRRSMLDFLRSALREAKRRSRKQPVPVQPNILPTYTPPPLHWRSVFDLSDEEISEQKGWDAYAISLEKQNKPKPIPQLPMGLPLGAIPGLYNTPLTEDETRAQAAKLIPYLERAVEELERAGAQTWNEMYPGLPSQWDMQYARLDYDPDNPPPPTVPPAPTANQLPNPVPYFQSPTIHSLPPFGPFGMRPPAPAMPYMGPFPFGSGFGGPNLPIPGLAPLANQALGPLPGGPLPGGPTPFGLLGPNPPAPQIDTKPKPFKRYSLLKPESDWGEDYPGTHLIPLYDELYEACWNGDNDKIRTLCLPPRDDGLPPLSGISDLLQITAVVKYTEQANIHAKGYTPLYVALRARKWDTARLIIEIAQKQLAKEEDEDEPKQRVKIRAFRDGDEDDGSDADSCASDQTEQRPLGYTNLARRFHTVSAKVKPNQLLSYSTKSATEYALGPSRSPFLVFDPSTSAGYADPITLAVIEKDVEAFNQIADMMEGLEEPMSIPVQLQHEILVADSPEMLDVFIRRTGEGVSLPESKSQESTNDATQAQSHDGGRKIYLGLDVDGKKRGDLARGVYSNAGFTHTGTGSQIPIAWQAASTQATTVLEYLNSPKAIEAYKFYAETKSTRLAKRLNEALKNTDEFPQMVGFSVSRVAETPVLAAIWNPAKPDRILTTLKKLMELQPRLTADGVRLQVKPGRMSPLLYLCNNKASVEVFDWMLANGANPLVRDERGWNILHSLFNSAGTNWPLIEHVLTKLPADVIQTLMSQRSRMERNSPFAIVVKQANLKLVELLLRTVKDAV
ncbi:hypothetical protein FRC01_005885, partial [Tulasnella sp. 417]